MTASVNMCSIIYVFSSSIFSWFCFWFLYIKIGLLCWVRCNRWDKKYLVTSYYHEKSKSFSRFYLWKLSSKKHIKGGSRKRVQLGKNSTRKKGGKIQTPGVPEISYGHLGAGAGARGHLGGGASIRSSPDGQDEAIDTLIVPLRLIGGFPGGGDGSYVLLAAVGADAGAGGRRARRGAARRGIRVDPGHEWHLRSLENF